MKKIVVVGSLNMDFAIEVAQMPAKGETVLARQLEFIPGGKGANQSYACAALGGQVAMLGCLGADEYGKRLLANLQGVGVNTDSLIIKEDAVTGMAMITVDDAGENSIVVIPGANFAVTPDQIEAETALLQASDIVILQMEIPMETILYTAKKSFELGKTVILDPAPVPAEFPEELYQWVSIIKPNEHELEGLVGYTVNEHNLMQAVQDLKNKGVKNVVATLGDKGVVVSPECGQTVCIPARKVEPIDTTAAGDTFTAAMAVRLASGESLQEAVAFANIVSSVVVTRKGAQSSIPIIGVDEELQGLLCENGYRI